MIIFKELKFRNKTNYCERKYMVRLAIIMFKGSDFPSLWSFEIHTQTKTPHCSSFDFLAQMLSYTVVDMGSFKSKISHFTFIAALIPMICIRIKTLSASLRSSRFSLLRTTCCTAVAVPTSPTTNVAGLGVGLVRYPKLFLIVSM